ncbi:MAG TPA: RluA family pseudouridine synthase [Micropepsaceae bacterium]|nr:RluA family pseudouridine synthase [Micropepsaceae bacterium]
MSQSSVEGEFREFAASPEHKGWRLDHYLSVQIPELSRARLQALIKDGYARAHDATIRDPNYRVKPMDIFRVFVPAPKTADPKPQAIPLVIVHEDEDLIVIDKPAGLVVHPAAGNLDGTLVNALLAHCGATLKGIGGVKRPGIVHRLDKDTSGLLVVAKNERAMRSLAKQFAAHAVERAYNAVVWGSPRAKEGLVEGNLGRSPFDRKRMAVLRGQGKPARTRYTVLEKFGADAISGKAFASLLECRLETGRTHQIRVHLAHLGHPLVGDATYGRARKAPKAHSPAEQTAFAAATEFPRQALHAGLLGFFHPSAQKKLRFTSAWPADFAALINALRGLNEKSSLSEP